jgi:hypothetical protein
MKRFTCTTLLLFVANSAGAQTPITIQEPDRVVARKKTTVDFSAVAVDASIARPADSYVPVRRQVIFQNLIQIRGDFLPELQKSVDAL